MHCLRSCAIAAIRICEALHLLLVMGPTDFELIAAEHAWHGAHGLPGVQNIRVPKPPAGVGRIPTSLVAFDIGLGLRSLGGGSY